MLVLGVEGVAVLDDGADAVVAYGVVFFPELVVFGVERDVFGG